MIPMEALIMTVNGFQLPDGFVKLCQEIREGKTELHWLLKGETGGERVDAYGNRLANSDIEFLTDAEEIRERTDSLWQEFGQDKRFLAGPEDSSSPGFVEVTDVEQFIWFGTVASGEPFCFDFSENSQQPSIITWNDAYWQRVAPDFETFISLFVPWTREEDDRRFGGPSPALAATEVPRDESRRWKRVALEGP
jgi:SMI1 / KNR4 family (SUKH-1)